MLSKLKTWIEYVEMNHHKSRDKQFVITSFISNDVNTYHIAMFDSYLIDDILLGPERTTYQEAFNDIEDLLNQAIEKSVAHSDRVLKNPDDYDDIDLKQAEYFNLHLGDNNGFQ